MENQPLFADQPAPYPAGSSQPFLSYTGGSNPGHLDRSAPPFPPAAAVGPLETVSPLDDQTLDEDRIHEHIHSTPPGSNPPRHSVSFHGANIGDLSVSTHGTRPAGTQDGGRYDPTPPAGSEVATSSQGSAVTLAHDNTNEEALGVRDPIHPPQSAMEDGLAVRKHRQRFCSWNWPPIMTMAALFMGGLAFAVGHHCYYASKHGQPVRSSSEQEWTTRLGTALAFLTKTCLAASVGFAYTFYLWMILQHKAMTVVGLDAAFGATSDLTALFHFSLYRTLPFGAAIVLVGWLIPICALVTPATLTVERTLHPEGNITTIMAPSLNWSDVGPSARDLFSLGYPDSPNWGIYGSPTLKRLFASTYTGAATLPMPLVVPGAGMENGTYNATFQGPVFQCGDLNSTEQSLLDTLISYMEFNAGMEAINGNGSVQYVAFLPSPWLVDTRGQPNKTFSWYDFWQDCVENQRGLWDGSFTPEGEFDAFVGCQPGPSPIGNNPDPDSITFWVYDGHQGKRCVPRNATFAGRFQIGAESQTVTIDPSRTTTTPLVRTNESYLGVEDPASSLLTYQYVFWAILKILAGHIYFELAPHGHGASDDPPAMSMVAATDISMTALLGALDLETTAGRLDPDDTSQWRETWEMGAPSAQDPWRSQARNLTIAELIEELSTNVSLSMFSTQLMWTQPGTPTNVTIPVALNIYVYSRNNLIIAYAVALAVSLLATVAGSRAYAVNAATEGVPHTSKFSSILRTTQNPTLYAISASAEAQEKDKKDAFGRTRLRLGRLMEVDDYLEVPGDGVYRSGGVQSLRFGTPDELVAPTRNPQACTQRESKPRRWKFRR